ncbi:hypothetical protein C8255_25405 [filamentous cyanobacterium CCP3]|nr:hypothetical protein C8255_25405 [filamentous cyanobacterium CCP3]
MIVVQKLPVKRVETGALLVKIFLKYLNNTSEKLIMPTKICIRPLCEVVIKTLFCITPRFGEMARLKSA